MLGAGPLTGGSVGQGHGNRSSSSAVGSEPFVGVELAAEGGAHTWPAQLVEVAEAAATAISVGELKQRPPRWGRAGQVSKQLPELLLLVLETFGVEYPLCQRGVLAQVPVAGGGDARSRSAWP